jgi:gamma-glutamyltranspeptidase/glutathione hydrolase
MPDWKILRTLTVLVALASPAAFGASFEPSWGRDGMVVTSVSPAAPVGQAILQRGGNAVDAAVASAFAAAVAHPFSSGLGGGLFAVVHDAARGESIALDAREAAPASADPGFFRDHPDVIRLAEQGVPVSIWHQNMVKYAASALQDFPETRRIQTVDGAPPPLGWILRQKDLAGTLRIIQQRGGQALAVGDLANRIQQATEGVVTELDLARYQVKWREPISGNYRGYQIAAMPPPSSGGVLLVEMLNVLQRFDLAARGKDSSDYIHLVGSTMKLAFADRARHLGDPDFYPVPVARLTSMAHADELASRLRDDGQPVAVEASDAPPDDAGTTHISVLDRHGNAVALTQSINTLFGSKITVPGTGIVLNNHMDDFSIGIDSPNLWQAVGDEANSVAPGKRPLSSMTPLVVTNDGRAVMALGSPMGTMIISAVLHTLLNTIDFGFDAQRAVMAPRFHHQWQPDTLFLEPEFPLDVRERLQTLGHALGERSMIGAAQLALYDVTACYFWGGADGRRDSAAAGVNLGEATALSAEQRCAAPSEAEASAIPR